LASINKIKGLLEAWIFSSLPEGAPWFVRLAHHVGRILYGVIRDVLAGQLTLHAMSLVYTTLLSVVPLLALSFSVLKSLGVHNKLTPFLYRFFEPMGAQGKDIAANILTFVDNIKVGVLGSLGLALLIYTVISLVQKVEGSFNYIWRVPTLRGIGQRFSNYLSVILIGPVLVVSAIGATASIMNSSVVQSLISIAPFGQLILRLSELIPFFMMIGVFTFVYIFIPNTRIKFKSALVGGIVGGISWQLSGLLFASFVVGSTRYAAIYSGFAVGIVLLIWLYLSWLILLLGSSIAYYDQHNRRITRRRRATESSELNEQLGIYIMMAVAVRFDRGLSPETQLELEDTLSISGTLSHKVVVKLLRYNLLRTTEGKDEGLVPGRSLDKISLYDILEVIRCDEEHLLEKLPCFPSVQERMEPVKEQLKSQLNALSLQTLVRQGQNVNKNERP